MSLLLLQPGQKFPLIEVKELSGAKLALSVPAKGYDWKMVVIYRGKHCPLCTKYLQELNQLLPEFNALGVDVCAVSVTRWHEHNIKWLVYSLISKLDTILACNK